MSARETILASIASALSALAGGRVYRSRLEQLPALPAIVIEPVEEESAEVVLGLMDRLLTIGIHVFATSDTPDAGADAVLASAWSALSADPTLGLGSAVQLDMAHRITWNFADIDQVRATLMVRVNHRTAATAM